MPVTRDEVIWSYRLILGRDPENEAAIESHLRSRSISVLRRTFLNSKEFRESFPHLVTERSAAPIVTQAPPIVFLHIPKCAGTTLHELLVGLVQGRVCPERHNGLGNWPASVLASSALFSGHFDFESLTYLPTRSFRAVTLLREPISRLVSLYRFLRAHRPQISAATGVDLGLNSLASKLDPVAFFARPEFLKHPSINNAMVRQMTQRLPHKRWEAFDPMFTYGGELVDRQPEIALALACERLSQMTAFGLQEDMLRSVSLINSALGFPSPKQVAIINKSDNLGTDHRGLEHVEYLIVDTDLRAAMEAHTALDNRFYDFAARLFKQRVGERAISD